MLILFQSFLAVDEIPQTDVTCPQYDAGHPFESCPITSIRNRSSFHHVFQERRRSQMDPEKLLDNQPELPARQRSFAIMAKSCTAEGLSAQLGFLGPTYLSKIPWLHFALFQTLAPKDLRARETATPTKVTRFFAEYYR